MALEVNVQRRFGDFNLDVGFTAESGLTALFGRSGSGKTSLVNILAGLEKPDSGRIVIGGHVLFDSAARIDVPTEDRRLGYVFQEARIFPHISVRSNLTYGMNLVPKTDRHQDFDQMVDLLGLRHLLDRRPGFLSGGEKQRVAIGRALLSSPRLLLMDEPLASLDVSHKNEILPFIERLRDELALPVIYVSHQMDEVIRLADTMVVLSDGKVVACGLIEDIMSRLDMHPFTGRYQAGSVFLATVVGHDEQFGLSELSFAANRLLTSRLDLAKGDSLRVSIRARDVSLSLHAPTDISVLNIYKGVIKEISADKASQAEVLLDIGVPLIARVTRKSLHKMNLQPGTIVYALVKAVAIDRHSLGGHSSYKQDVISR